MSNILNERLPHTAFLFASLTEDEQIEQLKAAMGVAMRAFDALGARENPKLFFIAAELLANELTKNLETKLGDFYAA